MFATELDYSEATAALFGEVSMFELLLDERLAFISAKRLTECVAELRRAFGTRHNLIHSSTNQDLSIEARTICSMLRPAPVSAPPSLAARLGAHLSTTATLESEEKMELHIKEWQRKETLSNEELARLFSTRLSPESCASCCCMVKSVGERNNNKKKQSMVVVDCG